MKISTLSRYGLRAVIYLAKKGAVCSVKEISEKEKISFYYLEKIFNRLKKSKLVKTKRGIYGGFYLAKKPEKITVKQIIQAIEGNFLPLPCQTKREKCQLIRICLAKNLWKKIQNQVYQILDSITLKDLIDKND